MENGNEILITIVICLGVFGVLFIYFFCKIVNVGKSERKAKMSVKKSDYDTKTKRD